jgi:hypothetical protein
MSNSKLTIDSVTVEDGTRIHFGDWAAARPWSSAMAGHYRATPGKTR